VCVKLQHTHYNHIKYGSSSNNNNDDYDDSMTALQWEGQYEDEYGTSQHFEFKTTEGTFNKTMLTTYKLRIR